MFGSTGKDLAKTFRLRHRRADARLLLALTLLIALLAACTVVSADAILRLPALWHTTVRAHSVAGEWHGPNAAARRDLSQADPGRQVAGTLLGPQFATAPPEYARSLRPGDYAESWRQAGPGWSRLGNVDRSYQVRVGPAGRLRGQIVSLQPGIGGQRPLPDLRVRLLHRGTLVATGRTDHRGVFDIAGLTTGTYSLIAAGDDSLLACALYVEVAATPGGEDGIEVVADGAPIALRLHCSSIVGANVAAALSQIATLQTEDVVEVSRIEPPAERIPKAVRSLQQSGVLGTSLRTHRVQLQADGRLIGRVRYLHPESGRPLLPPTTRVMLLRDGEMIADGRTDELGCFIIDAAAPGVYGLVAITLSDELVKDGVDRDIDFSEPVSLIDEVPRRPGYATLAVQVLPFGTLRRADQPDPPPTGADAANELLELDFALIDAYDMVAYTAARASMLLSGRSSFWGNNALRTGRSPRIAPRTAASQPSQPIPSPPGGGSPVGLSSPIFPPDTSDNPMSSARL